MPDRHGKLRIRQKHLSREFEWSFCDGATRPHARNQSVAVASSAAWGSRNFPGRTSTIATVSCVRRKTGLDVLIRVTDVQHHEDCQIIRLRLEAGSEVDLHEGKKRQMTSKTVSWDLNLSMYEFKELDHTAR